MKNQATTARRPNPRNNSDQNRQSTSEVATLNLVELKRKDIKELVEIAKEFNVENASSLQRQDLIFGLLQAQTRKHGVIYGEGVLETLPDGFGFL